jgi:hypothetical protein
MSDTIDVQILPDEVISVVILPDDTISVTISNDDTIDVVMYDGAPNANSVSHEVVTAGAILSANKAVVSGSNGRFIYADKDILSHMSCLFGVTTQSIDNLATGIVQTYGILSNNTWSWSLGNSIYLGSNGELTQVIPTTGFLLCVGFAVTATKMFIDLGDPIELI